jgi:hypothetical protein
MIVNTADLPFIQLYILTKAFEDLPASTQITADTRLTTLEVGLVYMLEFATGCTLYRVPESGLDLPSLEHPVRVIGQIVRISERRDIQL